MLRKTTIFLFYFMDFLPNNIFSEDPTSSRIHVKNDKIVRAEFAKNSKQANGRTHQAYKTNLQESVNQQRLAMPLCYQKGSEDILLQPSGNFDPEAYPEFKKRLGPSYISIHRNFRKPHISIRTNKSRNS